MLLCHYAHDDSEYNPKHKRERCIDVAQNKSLNKQLLPPVGVPAAPVVQAAPIIAPAAPVVQPAPVIVPDQAAPFENGDHNVQGPRNIPDDQGVDNDQPYQGPHNNADMNGRDLNDRLARRNARIRAYQNNIDNSNQDRRDGLPLNVLFSDFEDSDSSNGGMA